MFNRSCCILTLLLWSLIAARSASADGRILLQSPAQAAAAQTAGNLNPVSQANGQSITTQMLFANTPIGTTALSTIVPPPGSFVSNTASPAPGSATPFSGGWYYAYGIDPDATNYSIDIQFEIPQLFGAGQPSGIQDIGIALNDTTNHTRLWRWDTSALTTGVQTFDFRFSDGLGASGSTSYLDTGIDLTHVDQLQFSYDGVLTPSYPLDPSGQPGLWVQIDHVSVSPEPNPVIGLMFGTLGLAGWADFRRRRVKGRS
jgi:hypothetical protein